LGIWKDICAHFSSVHLRKGRKMKAREEKDRGGKGKRT
jgi:hypothetical protein